MLFVEVHFSKINWNGTIIICAVFSTLFHDSIFLLSFYFDGLIIQIVEIFEAKTTGSTGTLRMIWTGVPILFFWWAFDSEKFRNWFDCWQYSTQFHCIRLVLGNNRHMESVRATNTKFIRYIHLGGAMMPSTILWIFRPITIVSFHTIIQSAVWVKTVLMTPVVMLNSGSAVGILASYGPRQSCVCYLLNIAESA